MAKPEPSIQMSYSALASFEDETQRHDFILAQLLMHRGNC